MIFITVLVGALGIWLSTALFSQTNGTSSGWTTLVVFAVVIGYHWIRWCAAHAR
jgi:hypothetical protein